MILGLLLDVAGKGEPLTMPKKKAKRKHKHKTPPRKANGQFRKRK